MQLEVAFVALVYANLYQQHQQGQLLYNLFKLISYHLTIGMNFTYEKANGTIMGHLHGDVLFLGNQSWTWGLRPP